MYDCLVLVAVCSIFDILFPSACSFTQFYHDSCMVLDCCKIKSCNLENLVWLLMTGVVKLLEKTAVVRNRYDTQDAIGQY